jgi:hypothetical protein
VAPAVSRSPLSRPAALSRYSPLLQTLARPVLAATGTAASANARVWVSAPANFATPAFSNHCEIAPGRTEKIRKSNCLPGSGKLSSLFALGPARVQATRPATGKLAQSYAAQIKKE